MRVPVRRPSISDDFDPSIPSKDIRSSASLSTLDIPCHKEYAQRPLNSSDFCRLGEFQCTSDSLVRWYSICRRLIGLSTLAAVLLLGVDPAAQPRRIVAVGDIHGAFEEFVTIMQSAGLLDPSRAAGPAALPPSSRPATTPTAAPECGR